VIKFSETIEINKAPEVVFDFTQDYDRRLVWDTFLKKATLVDGAIEAGKGVRAYCVAKNGLGMLTEYVSYNRPKVTAVKMIKGPWLFKSFQASWRFKELSTGQTAVIFQYSFSLHFPFNLSQAFIKKNLKKNVRQRLSDLKNCLDRDQL
jgi:ribosome-associated toxin RatA of RatAB toxin-antitoxin module